MKTLTVRLPEPLVAEIEVEARGRGVSKSDVVRERLLAAAPPGRQTIASIEDLIGSVEGLPGDLSTRRKQYLRATGYGRKRSR